MSLRHDDLLLIYYNQLQNSKKFKEVNDISRSIFFMNVKPEAITKNFKETAVKIVKHLKVCFNGTKDISSHKCIIRSIVKLSTLCNISCFEDMIEQYALNHGVYGASCMTAYARLQNHKLYGRNFYDQDLLFEAVIQGNLKYSNDTKYFTLAIENLIQAYDIKLANKDHSFLVTVILTNLENNHKNSHKLLLELFQRVLTVAKEDIVDLVMTKMSWYQRNKHYLLIQIIFIKPEILLSHKCFDVNRFMNGLRCGLSQYHLYSSSLSVVKAIYDKPPFREELLKMSLNIILNGSEYELKNFFRLWFTAFDEKLKEQLYNSLSITRDFSIISSTSDQFYRSLIIRNAFNRPLSIELENSIKFLAYSIDEVDVKMEIFNILLSNIYSSCKDIQAALENILRFLKFLHFNMCVEDSLFLDDVMRKLPIFFNHLATNRYRSRAVSREIFTIIRDDLFFHGIEHGTYESKVFSIKMLHIMLKQYCDTRVSKKTEINRGFLEFLRENGIWDLTSTEIFNYLIGMTQDIENSDISGIANEIILDYFIKTLAVDEMNVFGGNFADWMGLKMMENFNISDVEEYHENISYCKMIIEYWKIKESSQSFEAKLTKQLNLLESRYEALIQSNDPVAAMEDGQSLFVVIDAINYALTRDNNKFSRDFILKITKLIEDITQLFLKYVKNGTAGPSFDFLDMKLTEFVESSKHKSSDFADEKHKLLLSFFFTTRALSDVSVAIANIINNACEPQENDYFLIMSRCLAINMQFLWRFCHKGIIEAASQSLGSIVKRISTEFLQQCNRNSTAAINLQKLLITLKHEIDCGRRHSSKTGEIRGSRGLILMSHLIIRNHKAFLKFLMDQILVIIPIKSFYDTQEIKFVSSIKPITLHLLAILVKDSELVEEMLPYYDWILLSTFRGYKESKDFVMQNALLQIIGNITTKISNHKRHSIDESDEQHYESKAISVYEHYIKFTYSYRIAFFDLDVNFASLSQTYIIILLEILSNFEYRKPYEYWSEMDRIVNCYTKLIDSRCEKIRILAAKCFAQWQLPETIPNVLNLKIRYIFSRNLNLAHGSACAVRFLIQRYEASIKFVSEDFDMKNFLGKMRQKVLKALAKDYSEIPKCFYVRYHLFELLMFLGFNVEDELIKKLMSEDGIRSTVGYQLWRKKVLEYRR